MSSRPSYPMALIIATRPWSLPASLVPSLLAVAMVSDRITSYSNAAAAIIIVVSMHLASNLANTYWDYRKGTDTAATADDRALVDGTVSPNAVLGAAIALYALAGAVGAAYAAPIGSPVLVLGLIGGALGYCYTAGPVALKYVGMGDVTIFLEFGPLLMAGVAAVATQSPASMLDVPTALASFPIGLVTAAIVHANNARDVKADAAAGGVTLAMVLGTAWSVALYRAYLTLAFVTAGIAHLAAAASAVHMTPLQAVAVAQTWCSTLAVSGITTSGSKAPPPGVDAVLHATVATLLLFALTGPTAATLMSRFSRGELSELPQATAQFAAAFGVAFLVGLAPLRLAFRVIYALSVLFGTGEWDL